MTYSTSQICRFIALSLFLAAASASVQAQQLPSPSRTAFKCNANGKVVYSDSPCLGAEKIDIEPSRGVDSMSRRRSIGNDVRREQHREMFVEAIRPLTGMDAKQFEVSGRRMKLTPAANKECTNLDVRIPDLEREEKQTTGQNRAEVQLGLFRLRERFRELGC